MPLEFIWLESTASAALASTRSCESCSERASEEAQLNARINNIKNFFMFFVSRS
jgi:hypothetical protein